MLRSLLLGAVCVCLGLASAQARSTRPSGTVEPTAQAEPAIRPVSAVVTDSQPICTHTRRRLWLEGEGWVVRKIATCR